MNKEHVSVELAMIAKEKGFDVPCLYCYSFFPGAEGFLGSGKPIINAFYPTNTNGYGIEDVMYRISAPAYKQLVEWIFNNRNKYSKKGSTSYIRRELLSKYVERLEFWYDTLIPEIKENEFVLEGFIGMLMNFFESEGIIISFEYDYVTWDVKISRYGMETIELQSTLSETGSNQFLEKKDAIHAGIKAAFRLLKEEK